MPVKGHAEKHIPSGDEVIQLAGDMALEQVRDGHMLRTTCLCAFSGGKDSTAMAIKLIESERFERIIPFYMYRVPHLLYIDNMLAYYEENLWGCRVVRVPSPDFYSMLNTHAYQPPHRWFYLTQLAELNLAFTYENLNQALKRAYNLPFKTWTMVGERAADNPYRRVSIMKNGPFNYTAMKAKPVWDLTKGEVLDIIVEYGIGLGPEYLPDMYGSSIGGLDYRFVRRIKTKFPEDWERVKFWYPMVDVEIYRYEQWGKNQVAKEQDDG